MLLASGTQFGYTFETKIVQLSGNRSIRIDSSYVSIRQAHKPLTYADIVCDTMLYKPEVERFVPSALDIQAFICYMILMHRIIAQEYLLFMGSSMDSPYSCVFVRCDAHCAQVPFSPASAAKTLLIVSGEQ